MARRLAACLTLAILVAATLAGCSTYSSKLAKYTRRGSLYHPTDWNAELIWRATFFSDDFRKEFVKKHEKLRYLSRPAVDQFVAEQEMRQESGWEFFVSMYTKKKYQSFNTYDDSFWKIYLVTDTGERISPTSVDKIPITPYEQKMFPYLDRWSQAYFVVFPKIYLGDDFSLRMESVVGGSTIDFDVGERSAGAPSS